MENEVQAELKQLEAGILTAQSAICRLEKHRNSADAEAVKKFDALAAKLDSAMRAKKSLHRMLKDYYDGPQPKIGT